MDDIQGAQSGGAHPIGFNQNTRTRTQTKGDSTMSDEIIDKIEALGTADTDCGRVNARAALQQVQDRAKTRVVALNVLGEVIPWNLLTREQEESLWWLFCELRA
jgi:hypothetical protein